jgi:hypothetical protein
MKIAAILVPFWIFDEILVGQAVTLPHADWREPGKLEPLPKDLKIVRAVTGPEGSLQGYCWLYALSEEFPECTRPSVAFRIVPAWPERKEAK